MSFLNCDVHGGVESVGPCCLLCGGCGDEEPALCPSPDEVVKVTVAFGVGALSDDTRKRCSDCGMAMLRRPNTFQWDCACGATWRRA